MLIISVKDNKIIDERKQNKTKTEQEGWKLQQKDER